MPLLAGGGSPITMLFDQYEIFAHKGQETLIRVNEALGFMNEVKVDDHGHIKSAKIVEGMEMFVITKQVFFLLLATFIVLAVFLWARFMSKETEKGAPKGLRNFVEPIILWVRDQIVRPNISDPHDDHHGDDHGHDHAHAEPTYRLADKLLPFFVTLFCFFATINLVGLIPGAATPTSSITVTGTMAALVMLIYIVGGMVVQKPFVFGFIKNLVPACPLFLWPLLFVIEVVGLITKPFALTVRLFANMTAGHVILLSLAGLAVGAGLGIGFVPAIGGVAIYGLEVFVALLQAYIFTYLSAIFIGSYLVPEH